MVHEVFRLHFTVSNELENIQEPRVIQEEGRHPVEIFAPRKIWPRMHSRNLLVLLWSDVSATGTQCHAGLCDEKLCLTSQSPEYYFRVSGAAKLARELR